MEIAIISRSIHLLLCLILLQLLTSCSSDKNTESKQLDISELSSSSNQLIAGESTAISIIVNNGDHAGFGFNWASDCDGEFSQTNESETIFTSTPTAITQHCTLVVTVSLNDESLSTAITIDIIQSNLAPQIEDNYQSSTTTQTIDELIFRITASDEDAANLRFEWQGSAGSFTVVSETTLENSTTSSIIFLAPNCSPQAIDIGVVVFDVHNKTAAFQFTSLDIPTCTSEITPAINITRTSGEAPFHVFVSASDTTADHIQYPYDEIIYQWDFGAAGDNVNFTHPVTQQTVGTNLNQNGPEAVFVYNTPGTYTITLTATHQEESVQTSIEVTVHTWSGNTYYFDPVDGRDINDGLSIATPKQTWQALSDWVTGGDHRQALIKRGTSMPVGIPLYLSSSDIRISSYGNGVIPQLLATENINYFIRLSPSLDMSNIQFSELEFNGNNGNSGSLIYATLLDDAASLTHVSFIDLTLVNDDPHDIDGNGHEIIKAKNHITMQNPQGKISDVLVWGTIFERNHGFKNGIYAEIKDHLSVVACTFSGGDGNNIKDHPIYPANVNHALYRWNDFQPTYSNNFSINNAAKNGHTVQFTLFDGNNFTGGSNGIDLTKHNSTAVGWFSQVIIQNNAFHDLGSPAQGYGIIGGSLERISIRDNVFYANPQTDIVIDEDGKDVSLALYRNKFWKGSDPEDSLMMLDFENTKELFMFENIFVNEGVSGGSTLISSFVIPTINNWQLDNNQYWAPAISTPFKLPGIDYYSFEEWQEIMGYDLNSLNQDPYFIDPANGKF